MHKSRAHVDIVSPPLRTSLQHVGGGCLAGKGGNRVINASQTLTMVGISGNSFSYSHPSNTDLHKGAGYVENLCRFEAIGANRIERDHRSKLRSHKGVAYEHLPNRRPGEYGVERAFYFWTGDIENFTVVMPTRQHCEINVGDTQLSSKQ